MTSDQALLVTEEIRDLPKVSSKLLAHSKPFTHITVFRASSYTETVADEDDDENEAGAPGFDFVSIENGRLTHYLTLPLITPASPPSIGTMFPLVDLHTQKTVVLYLDVQGPKHPLGKRTKRDIRRSLCRVWARLVEDCITDGIEGPICGVVVNRPHKSFSDRKWHSTVRLYDRYNYEIATIHSPMPKNHQDRAFYDVAWWNERNGQDFAEKYRIAMKVSVGGQDH
ncbi:hypothetical protein NP233_g669 [Leucocoprinus birnbaumii]|uniref:Uncharacterized protein n=1 Tax=Leucocoprinus birnbaumii TaxID=56174 RepID=A0AAD5YVK2_9AGAR|nr:hypothetical protein NP233_g669 [Leucocoprinus birnbaumii]